MLTAWILLAPLASAPTALPAVLQEGGAAPTPITADSLEEDVDLGLHALRTLQDPATGSYGGSVRVTQEALTAFAISHRHYRSGQGPFLDRAIAWLIGQQRADGAWVDPDAAGDDARARLRTLGVLGVLDLLGGDASLPARAKARAFLKLDATTPVEPDPVGALAKTPLDLLLGDAAQLLASRNADHGWGEGDASVADTARSALRLAALHVEIGRREGHHAAKVEQPLPPFTPADRAQALKAIERGAAFLLSDRDANGLWGYGGGADPGITALATAALEVVPEPRPAEIQQAIDHGLEHLRGLQKPNGSIHDGQLYNYVTSASVMALAAAGNPADAPRLERARAYLRDLQADEAEGYTPDNRYYGGVGYGDDEKPDLSNLGFALEALATGPADENREAFKKALTFLQRCQNYSETNDISIQTDDGKIEAGTDGGGTYGPGESKAGYIDMGDGVKVPRSYGSMSYQLLRGYLFAGLSKDDPRVKVLWGWLQKHYTLDVNPGFETSSDPTASYQGLFYYFFTMSRALDLYGQDTVVDAQGVKHSWRADMIGRLVAMQRQDGSWLNVNSPRWFEGNPALATAYALCTLGEALPGN